MEINDNMTDEEILAYLNDLDTEQEDLDEKLDGEKTSNIEDDIKEHEQFLKEQQKLPLHKRRKKNPPVVVERKTRVFQIKNEYVQNNRTHELFEAIDKDILRDMIVVETKDITEMMDRCKARIYKKIEQCLMKKIPNELKLCFKRYPQAFAVHPGFEYRAAEAYGGGKLWVTPNIPIYFDQFAENGIMLKYFDHIMPMIDKNVQKYHYYAGRLLKQETKIATNLSKVDTLIDLLHSSVRLFHMYIQMREDRRKGILEDKTKSMEQKLFDRKYKKS